MHDQVTSGATHAIRLLAVVVSLAISPVVPLGGAVAAGQPVDAADHLPDLTGLWQRVGSDGGARYLLSHTGPSGNRIVAVRSPFMRTIRCSDKGSVASEDPAVGPASGALLFEGTLAGSRIFAQSQICVFPRAGSAAPEPPRYDFTELAYALNPDHTFLSATYPAVANGNVRMTERDASLERVGAQCATGPLTPLPLGAHQGGDVGAVFANVLENMQKYRVPTLFARTVADAYSFQTSSGGPDETLLDERRMRLRPETMAELVRFSNGPTYPYQSWESIIGAIMTVYQEATLAHLDRADANDPSVAGPIGRGMAYYEQAHPGYGKRVYFEAAAQYVARRVGIWLQAFSYLSSEIARDDLTAAKVNGLRQLYDQQMAEQTFGSYDRVDMGPGTPLLTPIGPVVTPMLTETRVRTDRPMPVGMADFLDRYVLADWTPARFDDVGCFLDMAREGARQ